MSNELKVSPGPWRFSSKDFDCADGNECAIGSIRTAEEDGWYVARIEGADGHAGRAEANAALIASAPELYEALDKLLNSISYNELEGYRTDKPALDFVEILGLAEQALKKARGEQ